MKRTGIALETGAVCGPQQDVPNRGYAIDPEAYLFRTRKDMTVELELPAWIGPALALEVTPDGIEWCAMNKGVGGEAAGKDLFC